MLERESRLDSPALRSRLRKTVRRSEYERRTVDFKRSAVISDIRRPVPTKRVNIQAQPQAISRAVPQTKLSLLPLGTSHSPKAMSADIRRPVRASSPTSVVIHTRVRPSRVLKRQAVVTPQPKKNTRKRSKGRVKVSARGLLTSAAILVILGGLGVGLQGFRINKEVATKTATLGTTTTSTGESTENSSSNVPSEAPAANPANYKVTPERPRVISIDKIKVNARVVRLGIKANNQLAAPSNIFDAGWYDESSKPGDGGAVVIDGHVSGPTKRGVFYDLKKLIAGDQIKVERGDGKVFIYKVVKTASYAADKVDMAAVLVPVTKGKPGLNLITCSGEIDASRNHYKDRTVVFTEQVN